MADHTPLIKRCERLAERADDLGIQKFGETMRNVAATLRKQETF